MPEEKNHILIIEDNEDILFMLQAMVGLKGYRVSLRDNSEGIESSLSDLSPDVILMDMLLSGTDGRDVCRNLKANPLFSDIPIIMISAHPQAREKCLAAGANFFVAKPFDMKDLFSVLEQAFSLVK